MNQVATELDTPIYDQLLRDFEQGLAGPITAQPEDPQVRVPDPPEDTP